MSIVTLVSGGLDSCLMAVLAKEDGISQYPLFLDYGQLSGEREWEACITTHEALGLPSPRKIDLSNFGKFIGSGITDPKMHIVRDAFLPGRNLLFLLAGGAYAFKKKSQAVCIGLLNEETHIFPDQTSSFVRQAQAMLSCSFGTEIKVLAPLIEFYKTDVIDLAEQYGITGTYSCHKGHKEPCGECISCREFILNE